MGNMREKWENKPDSLVNSSDSWVNRGSSLNMPDFQVSILSADWQNCCLSVNTLG